ncbi:hypothetical protein AX16_007282 [Volvariella volvacea WC 439]|nr:hypothetical protein AX16_007282 [Volvariella volvacea WC 439]
MSASFTRSKCTTIRAWACVVTPLLAGLVSGAPALQVSLPSTSTSTLQVASSPASHTVIATESSIFIATDPLETVSMISLDPNEPLWRRPWGPILGPNNIPLAIENSDLLAPPSTDSGNVQNAKWAFSQSHNRLQTGGWARQQNVNDMPIATAMASVNMFLEAGAIRELHWHKSAEWAYVLKGTTQITAVDSQGRNFIDKVGPGDLWYFPPGVPHSLQATDDDPNGSEFLLVFDDGQFSEDSTFMLTDWLSHVPAEVLAKNFQRNITSFAHIPAEELYIFPAAVPAPNSDVPQSPQGTVPEPFTFKLSQLPQTKLPGGSVKVVDSTAFKVSTAIAAAEVTVEPGAIRELHWHPTQDEWSFFLEGNARMTIFASQSNSRTFDYQAGDIGYVPGGMGHYVENIGNTTMKFLEIFNSDRFEDISLNQWLSLTPPELVKSHLGFDDKTIAALSKTKNTVI